MEQTKVESSIESTVNIASGFIISLFIWAVVVTPLIKINILSLDDNITIVSIFTITSWLRSYYWRRFFNAGLHTLVHTWLNKVSKITGW